MTLKCKCNVCKEDFIVDYYQEPIFELKCLVNYEVKEPETLLDKIDLNTLIKTKRFHICASCLRDELFKED